MKTLRSWAKGGQFLTLFLASLASGPEVFAQTADSNLIPVVTVQATQRIATENLPGVFTVFRAGNTNLTLNVWYDLGGTASNGVDYALIPPHLVTIPAGAVSNTVVIMPLTNPPPSSAAETVVLTLTNSPLLSPETPVNYEIGSPSQATVYIESTNPLPVKIIYPFEGMVFYAPTNILINAFLGDVNSLTDVEFFAGTNDLGKGSGGIGSNGGFSGLTWTNPPVGDYALTAVASYSDLARTGTNPPVGYYAVTSAPVNITVQGSSNLPTNVAIFQPPDGAMFYTPTNIEILAKANDLDRNVTNVEFFAGATDLGSGTPRVLDPPGMNGIVGLVYVFNWLTPSPGGYPLTAVATDNDGMSTTSAPVDITVLQGPPTNLPPIVRIISPANGAVFPAPVNIPLYAYASATDSGTNALLDEVTNLEFYADGMDLGSAKYVIYAPPMGPGPYPLYLVILPHDFFLIWSNAPIGQHRLTAVAEDSFGNSATSAPVNITVLSSLPPPTNRPPVVSIVATDPVAVEGTNSWVWRGETNSPPTWAAWPTAVCRFFTNCGPKTATFTVRRQGDTSNGLTVAYDIGGTASNGVDYMTLPGSVTIPAGERRALITIVPIDDGPPDVNKTVILTLLPDMQANPLPGYVLGFPYRAAAVILDPGPRPVGGMLPGGCFHLAAPGPDAAWFCIQDSTDMVNWTPVCTNQAINGSIDFVDPGAASNPARFYRAVPLTNPPAE